ncbi:hypothetical protein ACSNN7_01035 [Micromonospora sp. URMC 105]|uniref:hypothetical protein n=1 Tax=Micromonospora sp. URMC 105 TaxID=3423413 RepID=UPI003F1C4984
MSILESEREPEGSATWHRGCLRRPARGLLSFLLVLAAVVGCGEPPPPGGYPSPSKTRVDEFAVIEQRLIDQGKALVAGDEAGWLAAVDPDDEKLVQHYRDLFRTLRALHVTRWDLTFWIPPIFSGAQANNVNVDVWYCLATTPCPEVKKSDRGVQGPVPQVRMVLNFGIRGPYAQYLITDLRRPEADSLAARPTPWESGQLRVTDGTRVTVAAPPGQEDRLSEAVAAGDRAAAVTDRYARLLGKQPPARYLVYLAGDKEWATWNGGGPGRHYAGYAHESGRLQYEVVVRTSSETDLTDLLRHEFGHVATLTGADRAGASVVDVYKWLTEGIAEYIESQGASPTARPTMTAARDWLRGQRRMTKLGLWPLTPQANQKEITAFYGISHLAVDCMARRYGEDNMFAFFSGVMHRRQSPYDVSPTAYREDWDTVQRTCITQIYRTLRL